MSRGALAAAVVALAAGAAGGCDSDDNPLETQTTHRQCRMPFTEYDAGRSIAGLEREVIATTCGRRPNVTYIYGTCEASSDMGCAPPLEVQTWSACHRKPHVTGGPDTDVSRGEVTIAIFARNRALAERAIAALRKAKPADRSLPLTRKLRACGAR